MSKISKKINRKVFFFIFLFLVMSICTTTAYSPTHYRPIHINNTGGTEQTYYQVPLNITYDSDMNIDFSDIRVKNKTSGEFVPYWIEDKVDGSWCKIWFNASSIPANSWCNDTYYLYYGDPSASDASDGDATFEFFDDFASTLSYDTTKWDKVGSGVVHKVCENQFTASHGGQGLANDGTYFYWGHSNGAGVDGTIYKIKMSDGSEVDSFSGPPHAAGGDWRDDHNTLLFSSGGSETPEVWEINPSTGAKIREWDFSGEGYNQGALIAYKSEERIYLFTSNSSGFKIREYQINDDGTWSAIGIEYSHSSLGTPQGLDFIDGHLYYLYDNGISKLQLNDDGGITILETLSSLPGGEKEGLTYLNGQFYYGDINLVIRKVLHQIACDISSNHVSLYSKNASYGIGTAIRCRWRASSTTLDYPGFGYGNKGTSDIVDDSSGGHGVVIGKLYSANNYLQGRQTNDGTNRATTDNICSSQDQFHVFEIRRKSSSADYVVDDGSPVTLSNYYPTENLYVGVGGHHSYGDSGESIADWFLVRKYASPEPSALLGAEQNVGGGECTAPTISSLTNSTPTTNSVTITWITNQSADNRVKYSRNPDLSDYSWSSWNNDTTSVSITLTGLDPNTVYYYQAWSFNGTNSSCYTTEPTSQPYKNFTTQQETSGECTSPEISSLTVLDITANSAVISWQTNQSSDNRVKYSKNSDLSNYSWSSWDNDTTSVSITLSGLENNTTYYYQVWSYNGTNSSCYTIEPSSEPYKNFTTMSMSESESSESSHDIISIKEWLSESQITYELIFILIIVVLSVLIIRAFLFGGITEEEIIMAVKFIILTVIVLIIGVAIIQNLEGLI